MPSVKVSKANLVNRPKNVSLLTSAQMTKTFGKPSALGEYLVTIQLPYPMVLAWDKSETITRMRCHKLVAPRLLAIFNELLKTYGLEEIKRLGIDRFGGCFNFRAMRGGSDWSKHSWGTAIDLDPERNLLRESSNTARFARLEYKPMIEIFYKHGFASLGVEKDMDWMHFEATC